MAYPEKRQPMEPIRQSKRRKEDGANPSPQQIDKATSLMLAIGVIILLIILSGAYYTNIHKTPRQRFATTEIPKNPSAVDSTKIPTIRAKPPEHGK